MWGPGNALRLYKARRSALLLYVPLAAFLPPAAHLLLPLLVPVVLLLLLPALLLLLLPLLLLTRLRHPQLRQRTFPQIAFALPSPSFIAQSSMQRAALEMSFGPPFVPTCGAAGG
eukprot:COSAG04_NODE_1031_length_8627_cov_10.660765_6_plen_115_part_00